MEFGFVVPNNVGVEDPYDVVSVGVHAEVVERVSVRVDMSRVHPGTVAEYADAGVSELVVGLGTADVSAMRGEIDRFAEAMLADR